MKIKKFLNYDDDGGSARLLINLFGSAYNVLI